MTHPTADAAGEVREDFQPAPGKFGAIFTHLERYTPEQRAEAFWRMENRWCWDCGREEAEEGAHGNCGSAQAIASAVAAARAEEREACAVIAEQHASIFDFDEQDVALDIAAMIRARAATPQEGGR